MKFSMKKKEDYFVLALALILLVIVFALALFSYIVSKPETPEQPLVSTPTVTPLPTDPFTGTSPAVLIDVEAQKKLLDKVTTRPSISTDDAFAKAKILSLLPPGIKSGIVYESANVRIDYTISTDLFQVEILTINIAQAKAEANIWFISHGVSQRGICDYPVMFYLSSDILNQLRGKSVQFSPIGNSC